MNTSQKDLCNRLSRIEGQVAALRRALESGAATDCERILIQTKAASSGIKRFAEAFSRTYARECIAKDAGKQRFSRELDSIISSAFSLS